MIARQLTFVGALLFAASSAASGPTLSPGEPLSFRVDGMKRVGGGL